MVFGYPKTCVYQVIFDQDGIHDTNIVQYIIMHVLVL